MARIGLLGGTFNPPHIGHLVCAQEARDQLGLDRVLLVPAHVPPHKEVPADPGAEVRAALCEAAVAGDEGLGVERLELGREGPSYTVDTLRALHERAPGDELTFIVGADMAGLLPTGWREPREVLRLARLAVAEREGARRGDLEALLAPLHDGSRVVFFEMPRLDVSSTDLRRRIADGRPVRHLLPEAVERAVARDGLYREGDAGAPAPAPTTRPEGPATST
jgi:nicotinate-nucleotide adenylyltransferase